MQYYRYNAGRFEHVSVAELERQAAELTVPTLRTTMEVIKGDVSEIIHQPQSNGAVFQVHVRKIYFLFIIHVHTL